VKVAAGDRQLILRSERGALRQVAACNRLETCTLLAARRDGALLMQSDMGADLQRLVVLRPDGRLEQVAGGDSRGADLDRVVLDPATQQPLAVAYRTRGARNVGLDPTGRDVIRAVERRLGHASFQMVATTGPGAPWLVSERGDRLQFPRLHLVDPVSGRMREILARETRAPIAPSDLADKIKISFLASDGMRIHGFLTLPRGIPSASAPLVVNVHGGPWAAVGPGFNPITQLLANRGYAVFEPNFRGSTGYGRAYMFAPHGDFGNGRVQRDVVEGTRYLLAQGIGDPARVGIVGISFGGYSALLGTTFEPDLYKVAIAVSPPVDFGAVTRVGPGRPDPVSDGVALSAKLGFFELLKPGAAERLHAQSPAANVARLRRPVVILAGGRDRNVPVESIAAYASALKARPGDVTLLVDAEGGHGLTTPKLQQAFLYVVEHKLHEVLGGPEPAAPGEALAAFLGEARQSNGTR
jgi:dienelactone hydrolase